MSMSKAKHPSNTKHAGGRPTKYDPRFVQRVEEYLKTVGREQTKLPKRVDVALLLGVAEDSLERWEKEYPEFSGALTRVDAMQKSQLMDDGMYGGKEVNPRLAQFLLTVNHGLAEVSKTIHAGDRKEPLEITITEDIKQRYDD